MTGSPLVRGRATNGQQVALTRGGDGDYRFGSRSTDPAGSDQILPEAVGEVAGAAFDHAAA